MIPLPVGKIETQRTTQSVTATTRAEMDDEIRDETEIGIESHLPFDTVETVAEHISDSDMILSPKERKQLAREQWERLDNLTRPA
jgi:hypothetical protein